MHLIHLEGGNALSSFRGAALLARLQEIQPDISGLHARYLHCVLLSAPLPEEQRQKLTELLSYGDPYAGPSSGVALIVAPRVGTVSPWASKATDIAHNCGLAIRRVERMTEYRLELDAAGAGSWSKDERRACAALLHDRMTESVLAGRDEIPRLFEEKQGVPME